MIKHLQSKEDWSEKSLGAKGFTLIELLIVIIILGILAGIVVLGVNNLTGTSKKQSCKTEVKTVESAQAAYFAKTATNDPGGQGSYATTTAQLTGDGELAKAPQYVQDADLNASGGVDTVCT